MLSKAAGAGMMQEDHDAPAGPSSSDERLTERIVLEVMASIDDPSGSKIAVLQGTIREQHPAYSTQNLPMLLRKLERSQQVERTPDGKFKTTIAGKVADTPRHMLEKYFVRLFEIVDKGKNGLVSPSDFLQLLKMSGFCLTQAMLREIADRMTLTGDGSIHYAGFMPTLIDIVKTPVKKAQAGHESQQPAQASDWDEFESALAGLSLGGQDEGEEV